LEAFLPKPPRSVFSERGLVKRWPVPFQLSFDSFVFSHLPFFPSTISTFFFSPTSGLVDRQSMMWVNLLELFLDPFDFPFSFSAQRTFGHISLYDCRSHLFPLLVPRPLGNRSPHPPSQMLLAFSNSQGQGRLSPPWITPPLTRTSPISSWLELPIYEFELPLFSSSPLDSFSPQGRGSFLLKYFSQLSCGHPLWGVLFSCSFSSPDSGLGSFLIIFFC